MNGEIMNVDRHEKSLSTPAVLCGSYTIFHPWMEVECEGVNKAVSNLWRVEAVCPLKRDQWSMTLSPTHAVTFITRYYV